MQTFKQFTTEAVEFIKMESGDSINFDGGTLISIGAETSFGKGKLSRKRDIYTAEGKDFEIEFGANNHQIKNSGMGRMVLKIVYTK